MAIQRLAVVVDGNTPDRVNTVSCSRQRAIEVRSARNFDEAKTLLAAERPHLLVTDLRLGQYNGIHLVLRSRSDHPGIVAVVTSRVADPVLEAEVHRQNAHFLLRPAHAALNCSRRSPLRSTQALRKYLRSPAKRREPPRRPLLPDLC